MKSFKQHITEYKRYDKGSIKSVARGLELVAIEPKTGKEIFIMRGNRQDRGDMEKFAKRYGIELEEGAILEASKGFVKGWVHKSGKITDTTDFNNYHIKQVIKNPSKFGLNKNKILKILKDSADEMDAPYPEEYVKDQYEQLGLGMVDNDVYIEEYLQKKGWCMFVIDKTHGSISGWDERSTKSAAQALDDKYLPYETRKGLKLFEVKWIKPFKPKYITNKFDWYDWLEGKKAAGKRTKIGSTMAQFREEYITEAKRIEYILWGVPPGEKDETVVLDHPGGKPITNLKAAKKYKTILEKEHGVTKVRIQTIDFSKDISNMFRQAIR